MRYRFFSGHVCLHPGRRPLDNRCRPDNEQHSSFLTSRKVFFSSTCHWSTASEAPSTIRPAPSSTSTDPLTAWDTERRAPAVVCDQTTVQPTRADTPMQSTVRQVELRISERLREQEPEKPAEVIQAVLSVRTPPLCSCSYWPSERTEACSQSPST